MSMQKQYSQRGGMRSHMQAIGQEGHVAKHYAAMISTTMVVAVRAITHLVRRSLLRLVLPENMIVLLRFDGMTVHWLMLFYSSV